MECDYRCCCWWFDNLVTSVVSEISDGDFTLKDLGKVAVSTLIGTAEGAAIALCPAAAPAISAVASVADTAINGIIDGNSVGISLWTHLCLE